MGLYDSVMSDTVGTVFRAATGDVDPWTKQELVDNETATQVAAGVDPTTAADQAQSDVTDVLTTFTMGGDDKVGADPSQASGISIPSSTAMGAALNSLTNDNGTGCGITNLGGCVPTIPSWVYWAAGGVAVLLVLYLIRPFVGLAGAVAGGARE